MPAAARPAGAGGRRRGARRVADDGPALAGLGGREPRAQGREDGAAVGGTAVAGAPGLVVDGPDGRDGLRADLARGRGRL